jgi:hypothetical protein
MMKKVALTILILLMLTGVALGQGCAVCTKAAAGMDDKSAKGLNGGIIYLAFLPLIAMGTVGYIWWRHNKTPQTK